MQPYVSIDKVKGGCRLVVDYGSRKEEYYVTKPAILQAGEDLYDAKCAVWMCSSSVDFPEEYGADKLDVRTLLEKGWHKRKDEEEKPRRSVIEKMFAACSKRSFQDTLTPEEKGAFKKLKKENRNAKGA